MSSGRRVVIIATLVLMAGFSSLFAQNVRIDARVNTLSADTKNSFTWTLGKKVIKDGLDASSGASLAGSTKEFDAVRFDSPDTKKAAIPVGLRGLLLYPVSDFKTVVYDDLKVTEQGKVITVRYVHRGMAYELVTDNKGKFNVLGGGKIAKGLADNVGGEFVLKPEFVKAGGDPKKMSDLDWSKVTLTPDTKDPAATRWYEGNLAFALKKGVLEIKGNLTERK